jgi:hypothetical protein
MKQSSRKFPDSPGKTGAALETVISEPSNHLNEFDFSRPSTEPWKTLWGTVPSPLNNVDRTGHFSLLPIF